MAWGDDSDLLRVPKVRTVAADPDDATGKATRLVLLRPGINGKLNALLTLSFWRFLFSGCEFSKTDCQEFACTSRPGVDDMSDGTRKLVDEHSLAIVDHEVTIGYDNFSAGTDCCDAIHSAQRA
jgi:hypothetical protein